MSEPPSTRRAAPGQESGPATNEMHRRESHVRGPKASTRILMFGVSQAVAEALAKRMAQAAGQTVTLRKYENGQQVPMTPATPEGRP